MPIYEYECVKCGKVVEKLFTSIGEGEEHSDYIECPACRYMCNRILSPTKFRVIGFSAKNGYNLPNYDDVIDADGHSKERWGKG